MYCKIYPSINLHFCRDICVGENDGVREHDDSKVQLGEAEEGGTIGWCHTHTSCASLLKRTTNWKKCPFIFSALLQGKLKVIASGFLSFQGAGQLCEKAVSVNEGKDASIIISKKLFQCKKFQNLSEKNESG